MAKKINSRRKGNKAENVAAKVLETWTKKKFARTPSSGGLAWKHSMAKGDIVCTTEGHYFPFCMEIKSYRDLGFEKLLLDVKKVKILEFWEQVIRDAKICNKVPMLMMRYNGMPRTTFFMVITTKYLIAIEKEFGVKLNGIKYRQGDYQLSIVLSTTFISTFKYKPLKKFTRQWLKRKTKRK